MGIYRKKNNDTVSDLTPQEMTNVILVAKIVRDIRYWNTRIEVDGYEYVIQNGKIFEQISSSEVEIGGKRVKIKNIRDRIVKI